MSSPEKRFSKEQIAQTREIFHTLFPQTFAAKGQSKFPIKVGIYADLVAEFPDIDRRLLRAAIHDYVGGATYRKNLIAGAYRFDLKGEVVGAVTKEHEEHAKLHLGKMKPKKVVKAKPEFTGVTG